MNDPRAVEELEAALEEQARLGDAFERAIGTSAELASLTRLQAAGRRVTSCQHAVDPTTERRSQ